MMMRMIPTGFRFNPTDEELIEFLFRKISGHEMQRYGHVIVERDVYELDPQQLQWDYNAALPTNERFYFCLRENDSREVSGQGWWRATGRVKKVYVNYYNNQTLVGFKRPLTFHRFSGDHPHDHKTKRSKAIKTNWIMHEYGLESYTTDWRLCKIKYKGKPSVQEELENIIRRSAAEQQQQQQQQLQDSLIQQQNFESDNYNNPEAILFDFSGGQLARQQQSILQLDNNNINSDGSYNNNNIDAENMKMEAIGVENEQINDPINASCHPFNYYYFDDHHYQL